MSNESLHIEGDKVDGDKAGGDKVLGNKTVAHLVIHELALNIYASNKQQYIGKADEEATNRVTEMTEKFLHRLLTEAPDNAGSLSDPDMQHAVFTAQDAYARSGDKNMEEVLVDLLIDRAKQSERTLLQIVLNEAVEVVPKLVFSQFDTLSLVFLIKYSASSSIRSPNDLINYLHNTVFHFIDGAKTSVSHYQHLEYAGCGSIDIGQTQIEKALAINYLGLFWKGATEEEILSLPRAPENTTRFIKCFHNDNLLQFNYISEQELRDTLTKSGYQDNEIQEWVAFQNSHTMNAEEIKDYIIRALPQIKPLFDVWANSFLQNFSLTSVGIAIAHANFRRKSNDNPPLSIWIEG